MKLRIKGNSIRLRLLRSEVERLASEGRVTDTTAFGGNDLRYSVSTSDSEGSIQATFESGEIAVTIPASTAIDWAQGDLVGLGAEQAVGPSDTLSIVIEKDLVCVDRTDDPDREDAYPNPRVKCDTAG